MNEESIERGAARKQLGLPPEPVYLDDVLAPPVDRELLEAFAQKKLPPDEDDLIAERIASFRSWGEAYGELLIQYARAEVVDERVLSPEAKTAKNGGEARLETTLAWPELPERPVTAWAALLLLLLSRHLHIRLGLGDKRGVPLGNSETEVSLSEIESYLAGGTPLTLSATEHWLHCTVIGETVQLKVRKNPVEALSAFRVEFRRSAQPVCIVTAVNGVALLTPSDFSTAQKEKADHLCIITSDPNRSTE